MTSVENTTDLMESAEDQMEMITEKLDRILRESVDISSFNLADPTLLSDLEVHLSCFQTISTLILGVKYAHINHKPLLCSPGTGRQTAIRNEKAIRTSL